MQLDQRAPVRLEVGELILDIGKRELTINKNLINLTPSEFEILKELMTNPGFVITRDELAEKALGYRSSSAGRTLDSHIKNLRRKIEPDPNQPAYILTVYGIGYKFQDPSV